MSDEYFSSLSQSLLHGNYHLQQYFEQLFVDRAVYSALFYNI